MTKSKRHNGSIWLAVKHTFVSASSRWLDQSFKIHSSCCLKLSCPKTVFLTNQWVRWVGSWKFHGSLPLKSQIQVAVVSHAATGAGHENSPVSQCSVHSQRLGRDHWQVFSCVDEEALWKSRTESWLLTHFGLACLDVTKCKADNCWRRRTTQQKARETHNVTEGVPEDEQKRGKLCERSKGGVERDILKEREKH